MVKTMTFTKPKGELNVIPVKDDLCKFHRCVWNKDYDGAMSVMRTYELADKVYNRESFEAYAAIYDIEKLFVELKLLGREADAKTVLNFTYPEYHDRLEEAYRDKISAQEKLKKYKEKLKSEGIESEIEE